MEGKKTKGRQKIDIKKIENEEVRLITFSKRRSGIYRKISELVTLTGVEVAFVVFSPSGKPFSFGHPSIKAVINRFLGQKQQRQDVADVILEASKQDNIQKLTTYFNEVQNEVDASKKQEKVMGQTKKGKDMNGWWDIPIKDLNMEELFQVEDNCKEMFMKIYSKITERNNGASSSSHPPYVDPTYMINSSTTTNANEIEPHAFPSSPH